MKFDTNMLEAAWKPSGKAELLCFHIVVFFLFASANIGQFRLN